MRASEEPGKIYYDMLKQSWILPGETDQDVLNTRQNRRYYLNSSTMSRNPAP
jgi:hypothetical protein